MISPRVQDNLPIYLYGNYLSPRSYYGPSVWHHHPCSTPEVLDNHILPHTICSTIIQGKARTVNQLGHYLNISRSQDNKLFVHGAQVIERDSMATNGVMHVIDKVIVPEEGERWVVRFILAY